MSDKVVPNMLHWIQIWRLSWPFHSLKTVILKIVLAHSTPPQHLSVSLNNVKLVVSGVLFPSDQQMPWITLQCELGLCEEHRSSLLSYPGKLFSFLNINFLFSRIHTTGHFALRPAVGRDHLIVVTDSCYCYDNLLWYDELGHSSASGQKMLENGFL